MLKYETQNHVFFQIRIENEKSLAYFGYCLFGLNRLQWQQDFNTAYRNQPTCLCRLQHSSSALPVYASQIEQASAPAEVKPAVSSGNFLADAAALQAAEDALKALPQFGGKPVNVFQTIHFYGGSHPRITVDIQDPGKPDNIDHYEFEDGKWGDPVPVRISGDGRMKDNVFPLNEIKFANIAKIAQTFSEKATEVGAEETTVDHVLFTVCANRWEKMVHQRHQNPPRRIWIRVQ